MADSKSYWQLRAEQILVTNERRAENVLKDMKEAYNNALIHIQKELEAFYSKYADATGLSLAETKQRLNPKELLEYKTEQEYYLNRVAVLGVRPSFMQTLKKASARAYVTRLDALTANIRQQIEELAAKLNTKTEQALKNGYEDTYYKNMFDIQKQAGFGFDFTKLDTKTLQKVVETKWLGDNYSSRIWNNKTALIKTLSQTLPQAFARGVGVRETADELAVKLNTSYSSAARLVRTEMNHISNQGTLDSYIAANIEEYRILATLDNRTSEICRDLDGKVFKVKDAQTGINHPPFHPNCRTTTIPEFADDDIGNYLDDRIARGENGENFKLGKYSTYNEWAQDYASASYVKKLTSKPQEYAEPAVLPGTLQNYAATTDKWEKDTVSPVLNAEQIQAVDDMMKELFDENEFCMRVPTSAMPSILNDGVFKNQFETGTTSGSTSLMGRKIATENLFGTNTSKVDSKDFEKYGYLGGKNLLEKTAAVQYGPIRVTFNKDSIQSRTTFTIGDSLGFVLGKEVVAGSVTNPKANGIPYSSLRTLWRTAKEGDWRKYKDSPTKFAEEAGELYVELQYHGKLTVKDIQYVAMHQSIADGSPDLIKQLKDAGIEIKLF